MTESVPALPPLPEKRTTPRWVFPVVLAIFVTLGVVGLWAIASGDDGPEKTEAPRTAAAQSACEEFVKDRLKSPSTAEFSEIDVVRTGETNHYTVHGAVDSQNSFGAMVRNTFACVVTDNGASWSLVTMTGLDR